MNYPLDWHKFCNWQKNNPEENLAPNISLGELNRFAARFRMAKSYQGLMLEGYPEASTAAYSSVLGVFLAYSALEQLYKAVGEPGSRIADEWGIYEDNISKKLKRSTRILNFLEEKVTSDQLKKRISKFTQGEDENILVIAQAVRHLVAHGMMSVHPKQVKPQTIENFCQKLTEILHLKTEDYFQEYIIKLLL